MSESYEVCRRKKHGEQKAPGTNSNYLLHISNGAMEVLMAYTSDKSFDLNFAIQTAILHDTIEDAITQFKEIKTEFGEQIAIAVQALTKTEKLASKEEMMLDSLNRINELQKEVGLVKIVDRITNLQTPPIEWSKEKIINYYKEAKLISEYFNGKNDYLNKRLNRKIEKYELNIKSL